MELRGWRTNHPIGIPVFIVFNYFFLWQRFIYPELNLVVIVVFHFVATPSAIAKPLFHFNKILHRHINSVVLNINCALLPQFFL